MSSTSEAAMARVRSVGAVETVVYRRMGGELSLGTVGRCQVDPLGGEALHLQGTASDAIGGCWRGCSVWDRVSHDGLR